MSKYSLEGKMLQIKISIILYHNILFPSWHKNHNRAHISQFCSSYLKEIQSDSNPKKDLKSPLQLKFEVTQKYTLTNKTWNPSEQNKMPSETYSLTRKEEPFSSTLNL